MSFMDNSLAFSTSWTTKQTVTATADSTNIIDITGAGVGVVPGLVPTVVGADIGLGGGVATPYLYVTVASVNGSPSANTLTIALKAAPDSGTGTEGAYTTLYTSTAKAENILVLGDYLLVPVPPTLFAWPSESLPRFYKLTYTAGGGNLAGLGLFAGLMLNPPSSLIGGAYQNNFTVA
jgi:hypothetical protein